MRPIGAQEVTADLSRHAVVGGVAALTDDQTLIFTAAFEMTVCHGIVLC